MPTVTFAETLVEHQARIGLSSRRIKNLRRILILQHQGLVPAGIRGQMGDSNVTWADVRAASADLAAELHVSLLGAQYVPDDFRVSAAASAELAALNKRLSHASTKRARAADGYLLTVPYGYRAVPDGIAELVAQEAAAIRTAVAMQIAGRNMVAIAAQLNDLGYLPPRGKQWRNDTVREIFRRLPVYAGFTLYRGVANKQDYWHGEIFDGRHAPIITLPEAHAVLRMLKRDFAWVYVPTEHLWQPGHAGPVA